MRQKLAQEEMIFLGIDRSCRGVGHILDVLDGKKEFEDLTKKEHQQIVDAWDSRNFMPASAYKRFVPVVKKKENSFKSEEEYIKETSERVIRFFAHSVAA